MDISIFIAIILIFIITLYVKKQNKTCIYTEGNFKIFKVSDKNRIKVIYSVYHKKELIEEILVKPHEKELTKVVLHVKVFCKNLYAISHTCVFDLMLPFSDDSINMSYWSTSITPNRVISNTHIIDKGCTSPFSIISGMVEKDIIKEFKTFVDNYYKLIVSGAV